jgi:multiple sugar transport system permease protein
MRETVQSRLTRVVGLLILSFVTIFPLYTIVVTSIKPLGDVRSHFTWIPSHVTLRPYVDIWKTIPLGRYFLNSLIVSLSATVCSVVLAIFAAYAISRYRFRGRSAFTLTVLSTQMFPGILFLLPLFVIFVNLERSTGVALYGTRLGLIITYLTFSLPFSIWMLVGYFDSIPRELEQAALVDGATRLGALFRILILFLWTFNEFNTPYVLFGPAPPHAADLLSLHIYVNSFVNLNFGLGSAMSVLLLAFLMIVSIVYIRVFRLGGDRVA